MERPTKVTEALGISQEEYVACLRDVLGKVLVGTESEITEEIRNVFPEFENDKKMVLRIFAYTKAISHRNDVALGRSLRERLENEGVFSNFKILGALGLGGGES